MPDQVVWERLNVFGPDGEKDRRVLVRGEYVPDDVDDFQASTLRNVGATRTVDTSLPPAAAISVVAANMPVSTVPALLPEPGADERAHRQYAVQMGLPSDEAAKLSKAQIRERFGQELAQDEAGGGRTVRRRGGDSRRSQGGSVQQDDEFGTSTGAEDESQQSGRRNPPNEHAAKPAWVNFAVSQRSPGVSEEDARREAEQLTKEDLVARYGTKDGRGGKSQG